MHNAKLLSHVLAVEFPDLAPRIHDLKTKDHHFAHMLSSHDDIDKQITQVEKGAANIDDLALEKLKKERLHLKDELFRMASK
jgi:uncharacterized protein YdcH (DUF465 family)